jgi:hypothetical protein
MLATLQRLPDRDRDEDHAREGEPDDAADRRDGSDEGDREDREVEQRQPAAAEEHDRDRDRREGVEEHRVDGRLGPVPLGHTTGERWVDEQQVVVAGRVERPVWRQEDRNRGEDRQRAAPAPGSTSGSQELVGGEEGHEQRSQRCTAVDVRPDDE